VFDIGFTELLLIGIVALVVIGPERLPAVAKTAGQWIAKLQRFVRGVKTDIASELKTGDLEKLIGDQRDQINELRKMVTTAKDDFESSTRTVVNDAKSRLDEIETSTKDVDTTSDLKSSNQSGGVAQTAAEAATTTPASPEISASSETSVSSDSSGDDSNNGTTFETLDGQTVSLDDSKDSSDVGRTGS